jgi:hypothetical protein
MTFRHKVNSRYQIVAHTWQEGGRYSADDVVKFMYSVDTPGEHQQRCEKAIRKYPFYTIENIIPEETDYEFMDETSEESQELIKKYSQMTTTPPPIIVHRHKDGWFNIIDGVHRAKVAVRKKQNGILAFIPIESGV